MSTGGARHHSSLLPETTHVELEQAWKDREAEATSLNAGGFHSMALVLRLYSLEIRLKWQICRHLGLDLLPKACKTHDLAELVIFTGLWSELIDPANGDLLSNWDELARFSKSQLNDSRYLSAASFDNVKLATLSIALDDPVNGVLAWLSRHP